ncbi:hypothetical protein ABIC94_003934 [Variovorax paradoxus]|uniref:hypothetical protein n=1 Tax=Variovorax paradoxus TaxID=34073 RepID=UPI00339AD471
MDRQLQQLQAAVLQGLIFQAAIGAVITAVMFYVLYLVVKAAVRDGVREGMTSSRAVERRGPGKATTANIPDMRAD